MPLIACPYCGSRPEVEFHCGGEAHVARPADPSALSDAEWADYLYDRTSNKGAHAERWLHSHGCGRWFNALCNTVSDAFIVTYEMGQPRPTLDASGQAQGEKA